MEDGTSLRPEDLSTELGSTSSTITQAHDDIFPPTSLPVPESSASLHSSTFDTIPEAFSIRDMIVDDSGLFMEDDEPFLGDLTSFLEGDDMPCDLNFDPIEDDVALPTGEQHSYNSAHDNSGAAISTDFDDLLDMVIMADNHSDAAKTGNLQHWTDSSLPGAYPDNPRDLVHDLFPSSLPPLFDETPVPSLDLRHYRKVNRPVPSSTSVSGEQNLSLGSTSGRMTVQGGSAGHQPHASSVSAGMVHVKLKKSRVTTSTVTSATAASANVNTATRQEQNHTEDSSVSSTSPDFPGSSSGLLSNSAAQDDPYFPLPALEVILMTPEARFMHLVQTLCREYPAELRRFMLAVSGDRGITPPPADGQVISVKSMLELRREIEQVQPMDTLLLERIIIENEQGLARHERILKEILRITCRGNMSHWEEKLMWGRVERKRLQEEADSATSASVLTRCRSLQNSGDPSSGELEGDSGGHAFGLGDAADDVSVTSLDSDTEPDQTDLPQAFCYPKGPDLLRSNRDVAHPHLEAPVADSVCQTQFGKVKFSVYPGIRWGRDPLRKKKRLERKLHEAAKDGETNIFICDDLLETLDVESSVDELLDCLTQHNLRCPKAAEWHHSRAAVTLERGTSTCRASRRSTSHLIIRKMADGTPFIEEGQRAPTRTMDREEFLSQLADGRMTLAAQPPEHYNQLLVRGTEMSGTTDCSGSHSRGKEVGSFRSTVSCAALPSQQDISLASKVAKDLLSRQTRDLYRSSLLRSAKQDDAAAHQFGHAGKHLFPVAFDKTRTSSMEKLSGNDSAKRFTSALGRSSSSNDNDGHWKTLMNSVYQPRNRDRASASSERKRSLDSSHDARQRKRYPSCGAERPRDTTKPTKSNPLPTILLQSVPRVSVTCQGSTSRKTSSLKQPLLLPKPTVAISSDTIHGSIAMRSSSCSGGETGAFSARLNRGYDSFMGLSQTRALRSAGLVTGSGHGSTGTNPGQDSSRLVRLEPEPAELEVDQGESGADADRLTVSGDTKSARRTITEPPSPKSLQARDKILRAMVSMTDDTDDVTSMHYHRPRHCDFRSLSIGGFRLEPGGGRGRLKIIYSARKIVYEFDYPPASEEAERRQLVHIEVKFSSVIALQSSTEELSIVVCQIPTVLVGRPASELVSQRSLLNAGRDTPGSEVSNTDPRLRCFVSGDIRDSPLHLLQLSPSGCEAACRTLGRVSHRFHNMLCWPPQLEGYVPRWRLVPSSDASATAPGVSDARSCQESSVTWLQSRGPQSCSCRFSCRSLDCPCSRSSLPCGYSGSQCECGPTCANTFNALLEEGVDVETAREDTCLVQNVFAVNKPRDIRRLLSDSQPCPHCHRPVEIRTVVPMQRPCPHCSKPVVFSWCQRKLRNSRNHCLVCIGCSEVNFQHCLICKFCTRRTHQRGPCTQCLARGEQWRSHRRYVTAEGQRVSRQLVTEMKLTAPGAEEQQGSTAGGVVEGGGPSATV